MTANLKSTSLSDIEIANMAKLRPINEVAQDLGFNEDEIETYGRNKAKVSYDAVMKTLSDKSRKRGKLILVTAITPTKAGEGKTTTSVGLVQALRKAGLKTVVALREPSMGPVFGQKGGGTGGGYSQLVPMAEINLHFTGDLHAISAANNLLASLIDNHIHFGNKLSIDPQAITFKRAVDVNDRSLRNLVQGIGGKTSGVLRETGFDITAASEVMATLCMSNSLSDLRDRVGKIVIGKSLSGEPITADQLDASAAMTVVLKDAIKPNIVQTIDGTPALVHGGPFANIAHGTSSVISAKLALRLGDYIITEGGFGADLGFEKFCDIVCQLNPELAPDAVVMVATLKALKLHGGVAENDLSRNDPAAVERGFANLDKHLENVAKFGLQAVVCFNKYKDDSAEEMEHALALSKDRGYTAAVADVWAHGGDGARELAKLVVEATNKPSRFKPVYRLEDSIEKKLESVATEIYGAAKISLSAQANKELKWLKKNGYDKLPVCIAKTQYSFSDNPLLLGAPKNFTFNLRQLKLSGGAGFIVALAGDMLTMPGLSKAPAAVRMDLDDRGTIKNFS